MSTATAAARRSRLKSLAAQVEDVRKRIAHSVPCDQLLSVKVSDPFREVHGDEEVRLEITYTVRLTPDNRGLAYKVGEYLRHAAGRVAHAASDVSGDRGVNLHEVGTGYTYYGCEEVEDVMLMVANGRDAKDERNAIREFLETLRVCGVEVTA